MGPGSVLSKVGQQLTKAEMLAFKVALVGLSMVVVIASVGEEPTLVDSETHEAVKAAQVVLLFI
jgi:hypothetical protein